ncbi:MULTISPECIES: hypothetical protein [Pseudomonas]|nr:MULTISPECIES: hypothetical protein [Pseudomonas]WLH60107.1 hypothetical protein PSH73_12745 [Pseudomonas sp. FP2294]
MKTFTAGSSAIAKDGEPASMASDSVLNLSDVQVVDTREVRSLDM